MLIKKRESANVLLETGERGKSWETREVTGDRGHIGRRGLRGHRGYRADWVKSFKT